MTNPYYNHSSGAPVAASKGTSAALRAEFDSIAAGFEAVANASATSILPPVGGNNGKVLKTNGITTLWDNLLSGLGITSSAIDSSPIGSTTPSTGTFTSLNTSSLLVTGSLSGAINMGGFKATNQADGTAATDSATVGQTTTAISNASAVIQTGAPTWLTNVTGTNLINATLSGLTSYNDGLTVKFTANGTNTGATNINISGLGTVNVTKNGSTPLDAGDITAGANVQLIASGGKFQLTSGAGGGAKAGGMLYENKRVLAANYTVSANNSAFSVGAITIPSNLSLTVPSGERYVIL